MRRFTARPLPETRYRPGRSPRTDRSPPDLLVSEEVRSLDPDRWETCAEYLYAVDLFNHGYWWEAHELFEAFWRAAGRNTSLGRFLQGLIQIAAALLKDAVESRAAAGLARSGFRKLRESPDIFLGIDRHALSLAVQAFLAREREALPCIDLIFEHRWSVWRQDEHGSRFEIRRGLTQSEALRLVAEFEASGHKQAYWAQSEALSDGGMRTRPA